MYPILTVLAVLWEAIGWIKLMQHHILTDVPISVGLLITVVIVTIIGGFILDERRNG